VQNIAKRVRDFADVEGKMGIDLSPKLNDKAASRESESELLLSEDPITLPDLIALGDLSSDIHESIRDRYSEDRFFDEVLQDLKAYKNFEVNNGLIFLKTSGKCTLCIPNVTSGIWRVCKMLISHAHSILAHLGPAKTATYL
jgi:hypothetical protein